MDSILEINGQEVKLTNLSKLIWPEGITKAQLIKYYVDLGQVLLPHIYNRPIVMKRYPDGINKEHFYQKECPAYAPNWIKTEQIMHQDPDKVVNYIICNDLATLVWLANQACVEIHAWLSNIESVEKPNLAVIDLDPAEGATFDDVKEVAFVFKDLFAKFKIKTFPKTSGSRGLHLFIPLIPDYSFQETTKVIKFVSELVYQVMPGKTTMEKLIKDRSGKVYLDYLQNTRGKTMAFPYSLRPIKGAPVSMPVSWEELSDVGSPAVWNINNAVERVRQVGDLYNEMLSLKQGLAEIYSLT